MATISLCMIVRDEADVLARCLDSAKALVDEIIIVDTGSVDDTVQIARGYTPHVFAFEWRDDFAAARNASFSHASMDFILWLDADDVIEARDAEIFLRHKAELTDQVDSVMMPYYTGFDDAGRVTFSFYRERIVNRSRGYRWHEPVHEYLDRGAAVAYWQCGISHRKIKSGAPGRNLKIYARILESGGTLSARGQYYYARELYYNGRYDEAIAAFDGFLRLEDTWVEDRIQSCLLGARCLAALERRQEALGWLLRSFEMDTPRSDIVCEIGGHFLSEKRYEEAAYWYERALDAPPRNMGFTTADSMGFTPHIQLCVCYDRLGKRDLAIAHNEQAAALKPDHSAVEYNRRYFENTK